MKRMMVMVVIVAVLVVQMPGEATAAARPMEMALNYTTVLVKLHGKQTLKVSSIAPGGASKAVKYEIANRKIASVTKKGVVKGKKIGVTTIRVTSKKNKSLKKLVKVIVAQFVPTKVKMSTVSVKMKVDQKKSLKATVTPKKVLSSNKKRSLDQLRYGHCIGVLQGSDDSQAGRTGCCYIYNDQWKKGSLYSDGKQGFCCPAGTGTNAAVCYIRRSDSDSCFRICHWCGCCK